MSTAYSVVPATMAHTRDLAPRVRQADVDEVWAFAGITTLEALEVSVRSSPEPWAGLVNERVEVMFGVGVSSLASAVGIPWFLGSDEVFKHGVKFLRVSRRYIDRVRQDYLLLENYVDERNLDAVKWVKWLGFRLEPAVSAGTRGGRFHRISMEKG